MDCNFTYENNRTRNWRLKTRYRFSLEEFEIMFNQQQGKCKICNEVKKLHVDHCHATNKVRGLLCYQCNNGLGCFKDNREIMSKATEYLNSGY